MPFDVTKDIIGAASFDVLSLNDRNLSILGVAEADNRRGR